MAKISIKYVLPTSIWKYFWRISRYCAYFGGISWVRDHAKYQKPCYWYDDEDEISEENVTKERIL